VNVHAQVLELARGASCEHLQLSVNGDRIVASPVVQEKQAILVLLAFTDNVLELLD